MKDVAQMREELALLDAKKVGYDLKIQECAAFVNGDFERRGKGLLIFSLILIIAEAARIWLTGSYHIVEFCIIAFFLFLGTLRKISGIRKNNQFMAAYGNRSVAVFRLDELKARSEELRLHREQLASEIDRIQNAAYYELADSLQNGHIVVVVTCENHPDEDCVPREPVARRKYYDIGSVESLKVGTDNGITVTGKRVDGFAQKYLICKVTPGDAKKWYTKIDYRVNGMCKTWPDPLIQLTWVPGMATQFHWHHVSINSKCSLVHFKCYQSLEELRQAVNLQKHEIVKNI